MDELSLLLNPGFHAFCSFWLEGPPSSFFFSPGAMRCFSVHSLSHIFSQKILKSTELPSPPLLPSPLQSVILTVTHPPKNLKSEFNLQLSTQLLGSFASGFPSSCLISWGCRVLEEVWGPGFPGLSTDKLSNGCWKQDTASGGLPSILSSPLNVVYLSGGQLSFSVLQVHGKSRSDVFELTKPVSKATYSLGPQFRGSRNRIDIAWIKTPPFFQSKVTTRNQVPRHVAWSVDCVKSTQQNAGSPRSPWPVYSSIRHQSKMF